MATSPVNALVDYFMEHRMPQKPPRCFWVSRGYRGRAQIVDHCPNAAMRLAGPFCSQATTNAWIAEYEARKVRKTLLFDFIIGGVLVVLVSVVALS